MGGFLADNVGLRAVFFITAALLVISGHPVFDQRGWATGCQQSLNA
jgi:hypothetical protein